MSKQQHESEDRPVSDLAHRRLWSIGRRRLSRKIVLAVLAVLAAALVSGAAIAALGGGSVAGKWLWFDGNKQTYLGSPAGRGFPPNSLLLVAAGDLNIGANHFRFGSTDGNYEFEHGSQAPYTRLSSYYIGTPKRTPIVVGGNDGQDVLSLLVQGKAGQTNDLQEWTSGTNVGTAVDGNGNLRLGNVVLLAKIVDGHVELIAQLPDGTTQVLAFGSPAAGS